MWFQPICKQSYLQLRKCLAVRACHDPANNMAVLQRLRSAWMPSTKLAFRAFSSAPAAADIPDSWRNPAAVLHGIDDIRFEDVPLPDKVADGHVRVQMRAVGICGSDVHYYKKVVHLDNVCIS